METSFLDLFGGNPRAKVLDFFMENDIFDYSKKQVSELSGVAFNSLEKFWNNLIEFEIIKKTRKVGKSEMYIINKENEVVKCLLKIDKELALRNLEKNKE